MRSLNQALKIIMLGAVLFGAVMPGQAADPPFPGKPIRIIVTFPPGGSTDAMLRLLTPRLSEQLGQPVLVVNQPGAGGNIGLTTVAKAEPDGHTLGLGAAGALAINQSLYPKMPYDALTDFKPVSMMAMIPFVLVGKPTLPAQDLREIIAQGKAQPGRWTVGHGGNGTGMHLTAALLAQSADMRWTEVPYKGSGPATQEVLAGQIDLAVSDLPAALELIKAGRLKAFAVSGTQRLAALPGVPTVAEAALPGFDSVGWFGLVAPAGTPEPIVRKLNAALAEALNNPGIQASIRNLGVEPAASTPEAFDAYIRSETRKWARVVKAAAIRLN